MGLAIRGRGRGLGWPLQNMGAVGYLVSPLRRRGYKDVPLEPVLLGQRNGALLHVSLERVAVPPVVQQEDRRARHARARYHDCLESIRHRESRSGVDFRGAASVTL